MVFVYAPVGEDHDIGPAAVGLVAADKQHVQSPLQRGVFIVQQRDNTAFQPGHIQGLDFHQLHSCENGAVQLQNPAVFRPLLKQVAVGAHINGGVHYGLFPDRVDGRIGHLGKHLLKVVEERLVLFRQHRQRNIRAHGLGGLHTGLCHGQHRAFHVLVGPAEGLVQPVAHRLGILLQTLFRRGQLRELHQLQIQPLAEGVVTGVSLLDLVVKFDPALHHVGQQHSSRLQP